MNNKTLLAIPNEACVNDDDTMKLVCGLMEDVVATGGSLPADVIEVMGIDYFVAEA